MRKSLVLFAIAIPVVFPTSGQARDPSAPQPKEIVITKPIDTASPKLMQQNQAGHTTSTTLSNTPRDAASGQAVGKRQHKPFRIMQ